VTGKVFLVFVVLGFLLATQAGEQTRHQDLESRSLEELTDLVGALDQETDRLQLEVAELRVRMVDGRHAGETDTDRLSQQQRAVTDLRLITGGTPGRGSGVRVQISDAAGRLEPYDLGQLVNELKSAAAEAIVVNGRRLSLQGSFAGTGGNITLEGEHLVAPYVIEAVGDQDDLVSSLIMPGGVIPSLEARPEVQIGVEKRDDLGVPALTQEPGYTYARSVSPE